MAGDSSAPQGALDLFSGSGSVGIEALSRGAPRAVFVDMAKDCADVALENADRCGYGDCTAAVVATASDALTRPEAYGLDSPFSLVTATPPYVPERPRRYARHCYCYCYYTAFELVHSPLSPLRYEEIVYAELLKDLANSPLMMEDTVVVVEYPIELGFLPYQIGAGGVDDQTGPPRLTGLRNRKYGRTVLAYYAYRHSGRYDSRLEEFLPPLSKRDKKLFKRGGKMLRGDGTD